MAGNPYPKPTRKRRSIGRQSALNVDRIRERIFERDEDLCVAYGHGCFGSLTVQHAIGRGMGGSAALDRPSLLRTMCSGHNGLIEQSSAFREIAEAAGWSLSRFGDVDPLAEPVRYPGQRWFLLNDDFGRTEVWP